MTIKLRTLAGVAAAALIFCSAASAQQGGQPQQYQAAPTPKTKIALLNLQHVVKSYDKWRQFEEEYKQNYKKYDTRFEQIKTQGLELKNRLSKLQADNPEAEQIKAQLKAMDREVQDLGDTAKKELLSLQDKTSVQIYAEVEQAVGVYAKANDLDLVLQYNDGVQPAERNNPQNIQRKMQSGPTMPLYAVPGMDISETIIYMLNTHYRAANQPAGNQGRPNN